MLVHHFLEQSASADPTAPVLIHGEERVSYGDLETESNRLGRLLVEDGIRPGDRVGLLEENSRLYAAAYYAILKAGAVAVPLNTAADARTIRDLLRDCGARGLVAGARLGRTAAQAAPELPELSLLVAPAEALDQQPPAHTVWRKLEEAGGLSGGSPPDASRVDLDHASIIYTSGSTGTPRGAVLRHLNLVSNTRSIVRYLGLSRTDRILVVLPFYYVYGKSLLNTHIAVGGSVVIENRFMFPTVALDTLDKEEATGFAGVPSTFAILLNKTNIASRDLPSLRYVTQAGGAMAPALIRRLLEALPGKRIFVMYGATEASARLSYLEPDDLPDRIGSIGKAIPNVELRILRGDGSPAEPGETGEIVARGSNIMEGYWGDPDETRRVLDADGFHTGDLGRRDEDGFFYVVGRKRDMIKAGAHRISPKEIEDAILEHQEIHEVAVIGVPDELLGEAIRAFVVLRSENATSARDLAEFCQKRLPPYKVPRDFEFRRDLPKNPSGKILKQVLREELVGTTATNTKRE
jgi:acyl-CoA synthetase (AMP-forming)/AMP-acid ligase II